MLRRKKVWSRYLVAAAVVSVAFCTGSDVNRDGQVNGLDVDPFVDRLVSGTFQFEADMNEDGWVNGLDIDLFVSPGPLSGEFALGTSVVPEPSTLVTAILGLIGITRIRRQHHGL